MTHETKPKNWLFIIVASIAVIGILLVIAAALAGVPMKGYVAPEPQPAPAATPY